MKTIVIVITLLSFSSVWGQNALEETNSSIPTDLMDFWKELQHAETLLVQTASSLNPDRRSKIFEGIELKRELLILLIRMSSGLNIEGFDPEDYHVRYPFSEVKLIQEQMDELAKAGYLLKDERPHKYKLSPTGKSLVNHYVQEVGSMIQSLKLDTIDQEEIDQIIALDHYILKAIKENIPSYGSPILENRLLGIQPDYREKKIWHHWQLVWTMLAALADEEEHIRKNQGMEPIAWFIRRRVWFVERMPWLADEVTAENIARDLQNYAPLKNPNEVVKRAITQLKDKGWLRQEQELLLITEDGLEAHDQDEQAMMDNFFKRWPEIEATTMTTVYNSLSNLNSHLEAIRNK